MVILHDAGISQGGWRAPDGPTHQLAVLREGFDVMILHDAGMDLGEGTSADGISIRWQY